MSTRPKAQFNQYCTC